MMQNIDLKLIHEDTFCDFRTINVAFDQAQSDLTLTIQGGYLDRPENYELGVTKIHIHDWSTLEVCFNNIHKNEHEVVEPNEEYLHEWIMNFKIVDDVLTIIGFAFNNQWVEWTFTNPQISIEGELDEEESEK